MPRAQDVEQPRLNLAGELIELLRLQDVLELIPVDRVDDAFYEGVSLQDLQSVVFLTGNLTDQSDRYLIAFLQQHELPRLLLH